MVLFPNVDFCAIAGEAAPDGAGPGPAAGRSRMLASQRQDLILREVERAGGTRVSELVDRLGVSDMTIRRDLDALAARGLVLKVHGGANSVRDRSTDEPGF